MGLHLSGSAHEERELGELDEGVKAPPGVGWLLSGTGGAWGISPGALSSATRLYRLDSCESKGLTLGGAEEQPQDQQL